MYTNPFNIGKIIGGLSKTLGVVNQIIPLYKEAKPMIQNARGALALIKEFGNNTNNRINYVKENNIKPIKETIDTIKNENLNDNKKGPTFFL